MRSELPGMKFNSFLLADSLKKVDTNDRIWLTTLLLDGVPTACSGHADIQNNDLCLNNGEALTSGI